MRPFAFFQPRAVRRSVLSVLSIGAVTLVLAACSASAGAALDGASAGGTNAGGADAGGADAGGASAGGAVTTRPRPAVFADLPTIELLGPGETGVGRAPTFAWTPVTAATTYRLSVLAPDAPTWAWLGAATSVRYGGVPEGVNGPSLRPGSWWSVAALGHDGTVLAMSELRAVSPTDERGPEPAWANGSMVASGGQDAPTAPASAAPASAAPDPAAPAQGGGPILGRACDLLSAGAIADAIEGEWGAPELTTFGQGGSWCEWTSARGSILSVSIGPAGHYDPDGWGADETLEGIGDKAYRVNHGWDRRIGFVHGDLSVMMTIDYTRVDQTGFKHLAESIDDRLP
jgi:hypothetical protein